MHRILLIVTLASTGCFGQTQTRGRVIGAAAAVVGAWTLIDGLTTNCELEAHGLNEQIGCGLHQQFAPVTGGLLLGFAAVVLAVNELREYPPEGEQPPAAATAPPIAAPAVAAEPLPAPETADPMLRRLTLQASVAARAGHCSVVSAIASRVEGLDPGYRRDAFERDTKIAACLRG